MEKGGKKNTGFFSLTGFFDTNVESVHLSADDAVEAWRSLLRAACADSVPPDVYFALGNLHYVWGELLEFGKRAELGAEVN